MKLRGGILFLLCSTLPLSLDAQSQLAAIAGVVTDPGMNVVPAAQVRSRSAETGAVRTTITDPGGRFESPDLRPGPYSIEVEASGFAVARRNLRIEVGQNVQLDFPLALGEEMTVATKRPAVTKPSR